LAQFDATGIHEVGAFIDQGGNDFWGVALAEDPNGDTIVPASRSGLRPIHLPEHGLGLGIRHHERRAGTPGPPLSISPRDSGRSRYG